MSSNSICNSSDDFHKIKISRPIYWTHEFVNKCQVDLDDEPMCNQFGNTIKKACSVQKVINFVSFINMIRNYKIKSYLWNDIIAGMTVAFMQLPQGIGYAALSGLPAVIGMYMGFFPILFYCILGTSRHISMGAIVVVSLMFRTLLDHRFPDSDEVFISGDNLNESSYENDIAEELIKEKVKFAMAITFVTGIIQILMAILQLGIIVRFLSNSIVSAFSTGVAIHVITSQLKYVLGISLPRYSGVLNVPYTLIEVALNIKKTHHLQLIISLICMLILYLVKSQINDRFKSRLPLPIPIDLIIIIVATAVSYFLTFRKDPAFRVVGKIPVGFPKPSLPDISYAKGYISECIVIAVVAFAQSISIAILIARQKGYKINANKELLAFGTANIFGPFFCCYTTGAAVSRTSVQVGSGGKSQVASIVGALFVSVIILAIGPLFYDLPNCVLSSIIIISLRSMLAEIFKLPNWWKVYKYDCILWIVTFISVVMTTLEIGLLIGIIIGIIPILIQTQKVTAVSLGLIDNSEIFMDIKKYKGISTIPGICVISFSSPLYYANVDVFKKQLQKKCDYSMKNKKASEADNSEEDEITEEAEKVKHVIIDCSGISFIDAMGADAILHVYTDYENAGITCNFSHLSDKVIEVLKHSGAFETLHHVMYLTTYDALEAVRPQQQDIISNL